MGILGPSWHSRLVTGLVSHNGEISHSGWIVIGEWWICLFVSSSEFDSACCFPLSIKDLVSDAESDLSASFSDFDRGLVSLS